MSEDKGREDGPARPSGPDDADARTPHGATAYDPLAAAQGDGAGDRRDGDDGPLTDEQIDRETPGVDDASELEAAEATCSA